MDLIVDSLDQMDHNKHLAWGTPFGPQRQGESHHKTYLANEASPFLLNISFPKKRHLSTWPKDISFPLLEQHKEGPTGGSYSIR